MSFTPTWNGTSAMLTFKSPNPIGVGACGHPNWTSDVYQYDNPYAIPLSEQLAHLKELHANLYRVDFYAGAVAQRVTEVADACLENGTPVLPLLFPIANTASWTCFTNITDSDEDLQTLYQTVRTNTAIFWNLLHGKIFTRNGHECWIIGNELELYAKKVWVANNPSDYDLAKMKKIYWYVKGTIDELKSLDPNCYVAMNCYAYYLWGVFRMLQNPAWMDASMASYAPVQWDITSLHFYLSNGVPYNLYKPSSDAQNNAIAIAKSFTAMWGIDEINQSKGSNGGDASIGFGDEAAQASRCTKDFPDIFMYCDQNPVWFIVYALYDRVTPVDYKLGFRKYTGTGVEGDPYVDAGEKQAFQPLARFFNWLKNTHTN